MGDREGRGKEAKTVQRRGYKLYVTRKISCLCSMGWRHFLSPPNAHWHMNKQNVVHIHNEILCVCSFTVLTGSFATPWTVAHQARILKWVALSFSGGSSQPRDQTHISCSGRRSLYHWATWEAHYLLPSVKQTAVLHSKGHDLLLLWVTSKSPKWTL